MNPKFGRFFAWIVRTASTRVSSFYYAYAFVVFVGILTNDGDLLSRVDVNSGSRLNPKFVFSAFRILVTFRAFLRMDDGSRSLSSR